MYRAAGAGNANAPGRGRSCMTCAVDREGFTPEEPLDVT
jgi:hypothetical protein